MVGRKTGTHRFLSLVFLLPPASNVSFAQEAVEPTKPAPLTAETMWSMHRLGAPTVSPDGKWAALAVTRFDIKEDKPLSDIWLVPTTPGDARLMTTHVSAESGPVWSPDGKWIAFTAKRDEDKDAQVYAIPTDGGEARRVTNIPTGASALKWFPDSKRIAFITRVWTDLKTWEEMKTRLEEREKSKMTAKVWDKPLIRYWDHWLDDREAHLYSIPIEGGEPQAITLGTGLQLSRTEPGPDSYDVSPDGQEIAFSADTDTTGIDPNVDVFLVPAEGGTPVNITTANPADDDAPLYSPGGRRLAYLRQTVKYFYGDRSRLMIYDRVDKTTANCTEEWDRSAGGLVWSPDGVTLYGAIDDAGTVRVHRFDSKPGVKPTAITKDTSFSNLALSRDGSILVALRQSFNEPPTLVRIDPRTGDATKLSTFNDEILAKVAFGKYESVTYKGANGDPIQMWVVYPPEFDPAKKWPVYLAIHGGPHNGVIDSFFWRWNAQVFASWGYVTAWHNFHGSSGFGQSFTDSINPNWADLPFEDTINAARWLAEKPWVDGDRMAAGGGSYGGYLSTVILGRDHPFKTLVVHAGVYNLYTQDGADYSGVKKRFGEHWEAREMLERVSPHLQAGRFTTPALVIHGELDYRVPVNHAFELFHTLKKRGVKSKLVYYPNENHWILKPQNSLFWYKTKQEWLKEFIGAGPTGG